jgi:acyl-coenzyme A thioesterase PaaI-like protein
VKPDTAPDAGALMALTLARALAAATRTAAGADTRLVSISCDLIGVPDPEEMQVAETRIVRATRTLVFAEADLKGRDDRRLMAASGVYRILSEKAV